MTPHSLWITPPGCPGQAPQKHSSHTPHPNRKSPLTSETSCPRICPLILKTGAMTKTSRSQPQAEQIPLLGIPGHETLSPPQPAKTQNPSSHLSRTARGQRGRSSTGHTGPDLSLSPPLSRGDRSGTAPAHPPKTSPCNPFCITCHRPEDRGTCTPCNTICTHTQGPHTTGICITRTHTYATRLTSPITGGTKILVPTCPHCGYAHIHADLPNPHRKAPCGRPYVLDIATDRRTS